MALLSGRVGRSRLRLLRKLGADQQPEEATECPAEQPDSEDGLGAILVRVIRLTARHSTEQAATDRAEHGADRQAFIPMIGRSGREIRYLLRRRIRLPEAFRCRADDAGSARRPRCQSTAP